jgi:hypothetical protein
LRYALHPGPDEGDQLTAEKKLEIAMPQGPQRRRQWKFPNRGIIRGWIRRRIAGG